MWPRNIDQIHLARKHFYRAMHVVLARGIAIVSRPSVRLSVCL